MKLKAYNVGCADCIRIEFTGESGKSRNIFIDSGFERTFRDILFGELSKIAQDNGQVDLWVITHIHDDHIGGAIGYANAVSVGIQPDIVSNWWYNAPRVPTGNQVKSLGADARAMSIGQSDSLAAFLLRKGSLIMSKISSSATPFELDGLRIRTLSPDKEGLSALGKKYSDTKTSLEFCEDQNVSEAKSAKVRDYHILAKNFDFTLWRQDANLENAGSIALLLEFNRIKILLLADSHPRTIITSLRKMGISQSEMLVCDLVKISHHGSLANNSEELYSMISCSKYLVTCDGTNKHGLAQKACIVRILTATGRDYSKQYTFYFTSGDALLRSMFNVDGPEVFSEMNFTIVFPPQGSHIEIQT